MSIQAGVWNLNGASIDRLPLKKLSADLAEFGPDGQFFYWEANLGLLYRPFNTNRESWHEVQPYVTRMGRIVTWDGRLDNRDELLSEQRNHLDDHATDASIVGGLWDGYGRAMFPRIVGDFAMTVWDPKEQELLFVRDYFGVRQLYYSIQHGRVAWCSRIDPLGLRLDQLIPGSRLTANERWMAGYLAWQPETDVSPVDEITPVPPAHYIRIDSHGRVEKQEYWRFDPSRRIHHKTDAEYEEHFRRVFFQSVKRRLRADRPVIAELSGGLDSSSIVCIADCLLKTREAEAPRLDTISRYTEANPVGDHLDFIVAVERWIGRVGVKFCVDEPIGEHELELAASVVPQVRVKGWSRGMSQQEQAIQAYGNRVLLSGECGDETTGAFQNPVPMLADLLVYFHWMHLLREATAWSVRRKTRVWKLLWHACRYALAPPVAQQHQLDPWLDPGFVERTDFRRLQRARYPHTLSVPTQRSFANLFEGARRTLALQSMVRQSLTEPAYPFADRDLCEFLVAVPYDQLLRPIERRSLLRRALHNMVPQEVIEQRGKRNGGTQPNALRNLLDSSLVQHAVLADPQGSIPMLKGTLANVIEELRHAPRVGGVSPRRLTSLSIWTARLETGSFQPSNI